MKNKLAEAKLYASAAYIRNRHTYCECPAHKAVEADEKLAAVLRILAAREPVQVSTVCRFERRRKP